MILHIPHSSTAIPDELREPIVLTDVQLANELRIMTDWYTDELYTHSDATIIRFPLSRLLVDVERFSDDSQEPMSKKGMGMIYQSTASGEPLKRTLTIAEREALVAIYDHHHESLTQAVEKELEEYGHALLVDCHSFPDTPLPCNADQSVPRPEICIGTDSFHTPSALSELALGEALKMGYVSTLNSPFAGSLVPMSFYQNDSRVTSIMIEVNRRVYMEEATAERAERFAAVKKNLQNLLSALYHWQHPRGHKKRAHAT